MLLMFYSSMEKRGLCLKYFCISHMDGQPSKKMNKYKFKNIEKTKNEVAVETSTHLQ